MTALEGLLGTALARPLQRNVGTGPLVGAIPGALPPAIGWTSVRGSLNAEIGALFFILFF
jgi:protoheme IX farnesyltransferase